ncbi:hypothetical protein F5Y06DRAFT_301784 [Hypoxylon sp. FL0890]|nr:hypothetical protein F5Y06DRAFT_301784 [Hypoxylon sp. FL0890]
MRRYEAGIELDGTIHEVCRQGGLEGVLSAPSEDAVRQAVSSGPIVISNVSVLRCDAILPVEQSRIRSFDLPNLQTNEIMTKVQQNLESLEVLEWLWDVVAVPVLNALKFIQSVLDRLSPHIWWIPTGPLRKFCLRVTGYYRQVHNAESVINRAMSSYSSSIKAII